MERDGSPDPRSLNYLLYLQNSRAAQVDTELVPDATVTVARMVFGG
jgi:hypothetical protein